MTQRSHIRTRILTAGLFITVGLTAAACSPAENSTESAQSTAASSSASDSENQGQWPRTVDSLVVQDGKATKETEKVEIPAQPKRIVSTTVTVTGSLLAIDAPVVATGGAQPGPAASDKGFFNQWAQVAEDRNVESLYHLDPNLEKIVGQQPDLIVVSAAGADSATKLHDQLKDVAPVVVVDYSDKSWEALITELGTITGLESNAESTLESFNKRLNEVKDAITVPDQPTNIGLALAEGEGMSLWTKQSAQGELLAELGFEVAEPAADIVDTSGQFGKRTDVKRVTPENLDKALTGKTFLVSNVDGTEDPVAKIKSNPQLADAEVVNSDHVYAIDPEIFRVDYYSALGFLDQIEKLFKK
ncbi:Fe2+-enterobactin ABC transporter substrate-binding protein [Corynebacterium canis]|uniref:Fe2+-enterobactin ABC transporter substrate-binding protein n=1 Tax=Corynebacterium canis TaxID=679663 RepID=A0A5C5UL07_9CORY|nr:Fe2+-enterobactin ABC transporter substrate-binding protein [Corynebacterium canis]TWT26497.1 Fe2+-enterobactin ABC transporter substrate-binding protein [Corynebacterium canis]WJY76033.1 Ferrienterobactin-binding periplasmic protein precursor [Corynebacterium canis]